VRLPDYCRFIRRARDLHVYDQGKGVSQLGNVAVFPASAGAAEIEVFSPFITANPVSRHSLSHTTMHT
jgi:hypothetical protein